MPFNVEQQDQFLADFLKGSSNSLKQACQDHPSYSAESAAVDAAQLINRYFHRTPKASSERHRRCLRAIAGDYPSAFVQEAKASQAFLRSDIVGQLVREASFVPSEVQRQQLVWRYLYLEEQRRWKAVEEAFAVLLTWPTDDERFILFVIALEEYRFERPMGDPQVLDALRQAYNLFVSYLAAEGKIHFEQTKEEFQYQSAARAVSLSRGKRTERLDEAKRLLVAILCWRELHDGLVATYCYDRSLQVSVLGSMVTFTQLSQDLDSWRRDGLRYTAVEEMYQDVAERIVSLQEESGRLIIPGADEESRKWNRINQVFIRKLGLVLDDLALNTINSVSVMDALRPLVSYSTYQASRYELWLAQESANSKNWVAAYEKVFFKSIDQNLGIFPFVCITKDVLKQDFRNVLPAYSEPAWNFLRRYFMHNVAPKEKPKFNRLGVFYDVSQRPLIEANEKLLVPTFLLSNNLFFYSTVQTVTQLLSRKYHVKSRNDSNVDLEQSLGRAFKEQGWQVTLPTKQQVTAMDGDVDLIVTDQSTTLLIQLKRTKLRLSLHEAHNEQIMSTNKAAEQLYRGEEWLRKENDVFTLEGQAHKWVVSTSFEGVGVLTGTMHKVNLLELLITLRNNDFPALAELIEYMETDKFIELYLEPTETVQSNAGMIATLTEHELKFGIG